MYAESIFIDSINIMVLAHIDAITIVICVSTPYKIVIPEQFACRILLSKECVCDRCG